MSTHVYGWKRGIPDPRDHHFELTLEERLTVLPEHFSLRGHMPPVYDQGQLGSCTANAISGAVQYQQMKQKLAEGAHTPSRLFVYWNERKLEGTVSYDAGAVIADGMKVVATVGAPPETDWPYDISKFTEKPPAKAFEDALKYEATKYGRVAQSAHSLKASIYYHRPVVFGFAVFESFESDAVTNTGIMPMPKINSEKLLGGHAVMAMGWKVINGQEYLEVRNSWGSWWGDNGYFWMPMQYAIDPNYCSDFWHINLES